MVVNLHGVDIYGPTHERLDGDWRKRRIEDRLFRAVGEEKTGENKSHGNRGVEYMIRRRHVAELLLAYVSRPF